MMEFREDMRIVCRGGENLVGHKPFFSWDSKFLLLVCDRKVKVYSLSGAGCVHVLEGHQAAITTLLQNPRNRFQVITASLDSTLRCWSYEGGVQLWSFQCSSPIHLLHLLAGYDDDADDETKVTNTGGGGDNDTEDIDKGGERRLRGVVTIGDEKKEDVESLIKGTDNAVKAKKKKSERMKEQDDNGEGVGGGDEDDVSGYVIVSDEESSNEYTLVKMCLKMSGDGEMLKWVKVVEKFKSPKQLYTISSNGTTLAHDSTVCSVEVHNLANLKSYTHKLPSKHRLTTLALHPSQPILAAGLSNGAICIFTNVISRQHISTCLHWHSLSLSALSFTLDGATLLSGGHECVLVAWSMSNHQKRTLPRLLAPILHISSNSDSSLYALCHVDNGIQIISNTWSIVHCIQGLCTSIHQPIHQSIHQPIHPAAAGGGDGGDGAGGKKNGEIKRLQDKKMNNHKSTKENNKNKNVDEFKNNNNSKNNDDVMLVDGKSGLLVMRGFHGRLQFYDVINDNHAYSVDITQENYISPEGLSRPVSCSYIDHVSLSEDADWLLTGQSLTYEDGGGGVGEVFVKFWQRNPDGGYALRTSAQDPHKARSTASCSRNCPDTGHAYFVTMATTKQSAFIVWKMADDEHGKEHGHWQAVFIGSFSNLTPSHLCLNANGSVLAVVFDKTNVTFWDPVTLHMTYKMHLHQPLRSLTFSRDVDCMYMTSEKKLWHWSPILKEQWHTDVEVTCMVVSAQNQIIAFTADSKIMVFERTSKQPIITFHLDPSHPISNACFLNDQLYFFNTHHQLLTLVQSDAQLPSCKLPPPTEAPSPFLPPSFKHSTTTTPSSTLLSTIPSNHKLNDQFMQYLRETPSHLLAPTKTWVLNYLSTLLPAQ